MVMIDTAYLQTHQPGIRGLRNFPNAAPSDRCPGFIISVFWNAMSPLAGGIYGQGVGPSVAGCWRSENNSFSIDGMSTTTIMN